MQSSCTAILVVMALEVLSLVSGCYAQMYIYSSGPTLETSSPFQLPISSTAKVCPRHYRDGFTVLCHDSSLDQTMLSEPRPNNTSATFYVDGVKTHTEHQPPFYLAGWDAKTALIKPWITSKTYHTVTCVLPTTSYSSRIWISCKGKNKPIPIRNQNSIGNFSEIEAIDGQCAASSCTPTSIAPDTVEETTISLFAVRAGLAMTSHSKKVILQRRAQLCPSLDLDSDTFTIECGPSLSATVARFRLTLLDKSMSWKRRGIPIRRDLAPPFTVTSEIDGILQPWSPPSTAFVVRCALNDGRRVASRIRVKCPPGHKPAPNASKPSSNLFKLSHTNVSSEDQRVYNEDGTLDSLGCVIINATSVNQLPFDWEFTHDGVGFRMADMSKSIMKSGNSALNFTFRARKAGRHALVLDLTTSHKSDHNDVWIRFQPGGISLRKAGHSEKLVSEDEWVKAYQKQNGRGASIASGDYDPHSIISAQVLQPNQLYTLSVAGRSSRVVLHRVIVFPCDQYNRDQCLRWRWRNLQNACTPGSFPYSKSN